MKKRFLITSLVLLFVASFSFAQDIATSDIPVSIANKFKQDFPNATDVEWEMDDELYNVEFDDENKVDHDVWYNQNGEMVKHKYEISKEDLPEKVLSIINKEFQDFEIEDIKKIVENNVTTYRIEFDSSSDELEVIFNSEGEVLSKKED